MNEVRRSRRPVKAVLVHEQALPHPDYGPSSEPAARVETTEFDGFGTDVRITAEAASGPYGGNDDPQIAVRVKFNEQVELLVRGAYGCGAGLFNGSPDLTIFSCGGEARALADILRKTADAVEAALTAHDAAETARWKHRRQARNAQQQDRPRPNV